MNNLNILDFFSNKDILQKYFTKRDYKKDEIIFNEGSQGDTFFIVEKGTIVIEKAMNKEGTEFKELAFFSNGNFFGEMAVIEKRPRTAQARAIEDTALYEIKREDFFKLIKENEEGINILLYIMKTTNNRLQHTSKELTLLFDITKLLTNYYTDEKNFLQDIVNEIALYFEGDWNIESYFYNYFNDEFEKAGSNCEFEAKELNIKPQDSLWINDNVYILVSKEGNSISAYMIFNSKEKLDINQKNNWATIFNTISYILNSGLKNIKQNKELIMLDKLKNRKNLI